jgi:hypothetical protein
MDLQCGAFRLRSEPYTVGNGSKQMELPVEGSRQGEPIIPGTLLGSALTTYREFYIPLIIYILLSLNTDLQKEYVSFLVTILSLNSVDRNED